MVYIGILRDRDFHIIAVEAFTTSAALDAWAERNKNAGTINTFRRMLRP